LLQNADGLRNAANSSEQNAEVLCGLRIGCIQLQRMHEAWFRLVGVTARKLSRTPIVGQFRSDALAQRLYQNFASLFKSARLVQPNSHFVLVCCQHFVDRVPRSPMR
jgi:hypothetical protein